MTDKKPTFTATNGLCNQNGLLGLESTAPPKVQEDWLVDQMTGGSEVEGVSRLKEKLGECKKPGHVSTTPYRGPTR